MPSVYDLDNFAGRVNYAAQVISNGRETTRSFDTCFEMSDGDQVAAALLRRAENNPKLAAMLPRYLSLDSVRRYAETIADVPTRDLPRLAREARERRAAAHAAWMADLDAKQTAIVEAGKAAGYRVEQTGEYSFDLYRPDGTKKNTAGDYNTADQAWYWAGREARPDLPAN